MRSTKRLLHLFNQCLHWAKRPPNSFVIFFFLTIIWFIVDNFSMEALVGFFASGAPVLNYYFGKQNEPQSELTWKKKTASQVKHAIWLAVINVDLNKADEQLFDFYRQLIRCEEYADFLSLQSVFSIRHEEMKRHKSPKVETYNRFQTALILAINFIKRMNNNVPSSYVKHSGTRFEVYRISTNTFYLLLILLTIIVRLLRFYP